MTGDYYSADDSIYLASLDKEQRLRPTAALMEVINGTETMPCAMDGLSHFNYS